MTDKNICECGCGQEVKRRFKQGHHIRGLFKDKNPFIFGFKGSEHPNWKGGKHPNTQEYIMIWKPDHPFCDYKGRVREHRLVMEEKLGRYLDPKEVVHHIDRDKHNNKIENLMLFSSHGEHMRYERTIDELKRICLLCNFKGKTHWMIFNDGYICNKCYCKLPEIREYKKLKARQYRKKKKCIVTNH